MLICLSDIVQDWEQTIPDMPGNLDGKLRICIHEIVDRSAFPCAWLLSSSFRLPLAITSASSRAEESCIKWAMSTVGPWCRGRW